MDFATLATLAAQGRRRVWAEGELIATDGSDEIRAPCEDCTVLMPARAAVVGREGVYLTRPVKD